MLTAAEANLLIVGRLPDFVGIEFDSIEPRSVRSHLVVRPESIAPNGYLHAAAVVLLADTACGLGAVASLPEGARSFTTIELKTNFLGTASEGVLACSAELVHGGRTTQVWDARVTREADGRLVALFRCTQLMIY
jgi:1,4-dihydroxy-2-naphthoyl-CoA hydrolase